MKIVLMTMVIHDNGIIIMAMIMTQITTATMMVIVMIITVK